MPRSRGRAHTTLTETAQEVVKVLEATDGIKMIAPGIIVAKRSGKRFITVIYTAAGFGLIVSGSGVQKIAVHTKDNVRAKDIINTLKTAKSLKQFTWNERVKKPGI